MIEHLQSLVQVHGVVVSATILLVAYVFIALEKIPKVTIALLGAAITIILGLVSQTKAIDGVINSNYFINYVDFNVIFLLVSTLVSCPNSFKSSTPPPFPDTALFK